MMIGCKSDSVCHAYWIWITSIIVSASPLIPKHPIGEAFMNENFPPWQALCRDNPDREEVYDGLFGIFILCLFLFYKIGGNI